MPLEWEGRVSCHNIGALLRHSVILDEKQLAEVVEYFSQFDAFVFDVETVGEHRNIPTQNEVIWLSLATYGAAVTIPMGHPIGDAIERVEKVPRVGKDGKTRYYKVPVWEKPPAQLRRFEVFSALRPLFFSDRLKIGHNIIFDLLSVAKYYGGQVPPPPYQDTLVNSWLLDENRRNGLKERIKQEFSFDYDKDKTGKSIETRPFSVAARYSRLDARYTWLLYHCDRPRIDEQELHQVHRLETQIIPVLLEAGLTGAPVSLEWLQQLKVELTAELERREAEVYRAAGRVFNIASPSQKAEVLYSPKSKGGQGLKPTHLTDSGKKKLEAGEELGFSDYSTDAASLSSYKNNKVAQAILAYQETFKLLSTYVDGYLGNPEKGRPCIVFQTERGNRIFGTFKQYGTVTGRFSSSEPNLQNVSVRTEEGRKIRRVFQAPPGYKLVVADYGQIELVILAHFAGPGALYDGFHAGIDPHTITASHVYGVPVEDVTSQMRSAAKGINFAVVYGAGPAKVAEMAGSTVDEARRLLEEHRTQFPEIYRYKSRLLRVARSRNPHHIRTLIGRKRRLPDLSSDDDAKRALAERQCVNSHIQGSAADLIKIAMVRLHEMLHDAGISDRAKLILTVHDELVVEAADEVVDQVVEIMREAMLGKGIQDLIRVPLKSDLKVVESWDQAK
mgnify:FL=1